MHPPFQITPTILNLLANINLLLGRYEGLHAPVPQPKLRRQNRIRTIKDSLAIEGNTLNLDQVSAIFDNKRVLGPMKDILEAQNAVRLYEEIQAFDPTKVRDLLKAHGVLMKGLTVDAGRFRSGAVGILKGSKVSHLAPPAKRVPELVDKLLDFLKGGREIPPLIRACIFHYEFEFIHPFSDGNGRLGRFWQSLILTRFHVVFQYLPVESLIKSRQARYYRALEQSDRAGNSTMFIEFSLETVRDALKELLDQLKPEAETPQSRLNLAQKHFADKEFTRKDYLQLLKTISTATASRDLALGTAGKALKKLGTKALARYRFIP